MHRGNVAAPNYNRLHQREPRCLWGISSMKFIIGLIFPGVASLGACPTSSAYGPNAKGEL